MIIFACEETVFDRSKYFTVYDSGEAKDATENESSEDLLHGIDKEDDKTEAVEPEKGDSAEKTEVFEKSRADVENNILNEKNEKPTPYHKRVALITPSSYIEGYGVRQYIKRFVIYFKVFTLPAVWLSGILWGLQDAYMSFFFNTQETLL